MKSKLICMVLLVFAVASVQVLSAVDVDGTIAGGEYPNEVVFDKGNYKLLWKFEGNKAFMAIVANTPGWVSVGFDPSRMMANSDMIVGIVKDKNNVQAIDEWCSSMFGPHAPDTENGGKSDILSSAGTRTGDTVVFEFSRLLDTGDKLDKVIPTSGKFKIMWAYGPSLQLSAKHKKAGSATIQMEGQK